MRPNGKVELFSNESDGERLPHPTFAGPASQPQAWPGETIGT